MGTNTLEGTDGGWQAAFIALLPEIETRARRAFLFLDAESRGEAVCETIAHCLVDFARLYERGCENCASAATLAGYAVRNVKRGRSAAGRMNRNEPLSRFAQLSRGFGVQHAQGSWIESFIEDRRAPVLEVVAIRIDFRSWFGTLSNRMKQVAEDLAHGFSTSEVAKKHLISAGRVSQMRRTLAESWSTYQHEKLSSH
ncbi:MAG: hypothetical protein ACJ8LM_07090 [Candidatus Udaeobacter sp.]